MIIINVSCSKIDDSLQMSCISMKKNKCKNLSKMPLGESIMVGSNLGKKKKEGSSKEIK